MDPKLEALHQLIRTTRNEVDTIYKTGNLPDAVYYKAILCMAYEYAEMGYPEEALTLVMQIPTDYFGPISTAQMDEDYMFKACAERVAQVLVGAGYVMTSKQDKNSNVN